MPATGHAHGVLVADCHSGRGEESLVNPKAPQPGAQFGALTRLRHTLLAILREVFDESAYARFLARHQIESSRTAYAAFLRENDTAKARRPRCC